MTQAEHPTTERDLDELLNYIRRTRNFDFTGYKRTSLIRRFQKRMREVGCSTFADYQDYLEVHPEEYQLLFDILLINVTRFFRDLSAWQYLTDEIVPRLVTGKEAGHPIRVWSAGCATGEEAYSLAMVLCEALGPEQYRARVKIYGTDADEMALAKARQATYSAKELAEVPVEYRKRYFESVNGGHVFRSDLRRQVIFGRHNLVQDAPISRLDLLVCRNTLMYLNSDTQDAIVERFHFALTDRGYLFLGKAETLLTRSALFRPIDLKLRVFTKASDGHRLRALPYTSALDADQRNGAPDIPDLALDLMTVPTVVVDLGGTVAFINAAARRQFGLRTRDVGAAIQDLEVSYRPADLRTAINEAVAGRREIERNGVRWTGPDDEAQILDILVTPLIHDDDSIIGTSITFTDIRPFHILQADLERANRELETAYEELQSTNEELETTNEELQSTVEELETTNEELQSLNEELETTNEELQSTNDELQTVNEELHVSGGELDRANLYLEGIVTGLHRSVIVLGRDLAVRLWNRWAQELWGLRSDEVRGVPLATLDIGLPVGKLRTAIKACVEGDTEMEERIVVATNRKGQSIRCRVVCTPLNLAGAVDGVILWMEELPPG
jgi:two-component system CheB/CheR fusion protein